MALFARIGYRAYLGFMRPELAAFYDGYNQRELRGSRSWPGGDVMTEYRSTRSQPPRKPDSEYTAILHYRIGRHDEPCADVWIARTAWPGEDVMSASTVRTIGDHMKNPRDDAAIHAEADALITDAGFVLTGEWELQKDAGLWYRAPCAEKERES